MCAYMWLLPAASLAFASPRSCPGKAGRHSIQPVASVERICEADSLAGRIEDAVCSVYGAEKTARVRASLAELAAGREHREVLDPSHPLMVQEATSYVAGLPATAWHDASLHKWARKLEDKWQVVRDELAAWLADSERLAAQGSGVWAATAPGTYGPGWKTLPLCDR